MSSGQEKEKTEEEDQKKRMRETFHLDDIIDLSIAQVFILIILSSFPQGTVRYTVLQSLNSYLEGDRHLSASSFYNSLIKLKKKGFITFKEEDEGKPVVIELTRLGTHALNNIGILAILPHSNLMNWVDAFAMGIVNQINLNFPVESVLVISQDKTQDLHLYPLIEKYAKHVHTLTSEHDFERYIRPYSREIHPTTLINKKIREPDDFFDIVFLPSYQGTDYLGLTKLELLKEAIRVIKSKGYLLILTIGKPGLTNHFLLDPITKLLQENLFFHCISEEELRKDLESLELENIEVTNRNGILLGIATIP
ncbi:MAG: hypothetical protein ACFFD4_02850 [Candidatus Odinarchaeota archaeon]